MQKDPCISIQEDRGRQGRQGTQGKAGEGSNPANFAEHMLLVER